MARSRLRVRATAPTASHDDFAVLSGAEVTVAERVDFIVVGPARPAAQPRQRVPAEALGLEPRAGARIRARQPASATSCCILAHPFRGGKEAAKLDERIFDTSTPSKSTGVTTAASGQVVALAETAQPAALRRQRRPLLSSGGDPVVPLCPERHVTSMHVRASFEAGRTRVHAKPYARSVVEFCQEVKRVAKWQGAVRPKPSPRLPPATREGDAAKRQDRIRGHAAGRRRPRSTSSRSRRACASRPCCSSPAIRRSASRYPTT